MNTDHLYMGDCMTNYRDQVLAGTAAVGAKGSANNRVKLTEVQVREIRRRAGEGENQYALGRVYGVSQHAISCIVTGKTWKWLP